MDSPKRLDGTQIEERLAKESVSRISKSSTIPEYYSSDEEIAWGPYTLKEAKRDILNAQLDISEGRKKKSKRSSENFVKTSALLPNHSSENFLKLLQDIIEEPTESLKNPPSISNPLDTNIPQIKNSTLNMEQDRVVSNSHKSIESAEKEILTSEPPTVHESQPFVEDLLNSTPLNVRKTYSMFSTPLLSDEVCDVISKELRQLKTTLLDCDESCSSFETSQLKSEIDRVISSLDNNQSCENSNQKINSSKFDNHRESPTFDANPCNDITKTVTSDDQRIKLLPFDYLKIIGVAGNKEYLKEFVNRDKPRITEKGSRREETLNRDGDDVEHSERYDSFSDDSLQTENVSSVISKRGSDFEESIEYMSTLSLKENESQRNESHNRSPNSVKDNRKLNRIKNRNIPVLIKINDNTLTEKENSSFEVTNSVIIIDSDDDSIEEEATANRIKLEKKSLNTSGSVDQNYSGCLTEDNLNESKHDQDGEDGNAVIAIDDDNENIEGAVDDNSVNDFANYINHSLRTIAENSQESEETKNSSKSSRNVNNSNSEISKINTIPCMESLKENCANPEFRDTPNRSSNSSYNISRETKDIEPNSSTDYKDFKNATIESSNKGKSPKDLNDFQDLGENSSSVYSKIEPDSLECIFKRANCQSINNSDYINDRLNQIDFKDISKEFDVFKDLQMATITEQSQISNKSSIAFDDTLEEMEMAMKFGLDYQMPNEKASSKDCPDETQSFIKEPVKETFKTEKAKPLKTSIPKLRQKSAEKITKKIAAPKADFFKVPEKPVRVKTPVQSPSTINCKTPIRSPTVNTNKSKFKNIVSPVGIYIKNSPSPVLCQNVRAREISDSKYEKLSTEIKGTKHAENLFSLPDVVYKPGKPVVKKETEIKLPNSIQKLVLEPTVVLHRKKLGFNFNNTATKGELQDGELTFSAVDDSGNISLLTNKQAYIK